LTYEKKKPTLKLRGGNSTSPPTPLQIGEGRKKDFIKAPLQIGEGLG